VSLKRRVGRLEQRKRSGGDDGPFIVDIGWKQTMTVDGERMTREECDRRYPPSEDRQHITLHWPED